MIKQVHVTQQCIEDGVRQNCSRCMIAVAVYPFLKPDVLVEVVPNFDWGGNIYFAFDTNYFGSTKEAELPWEAGQNAVRWDAGEDVEPFWFELDIPDQFLKEAA